MNDREIGESLRALPRAKASHAFTSEVMLKVRWHERPRPFFWRVAAAFATVVCLVVALQYAVVQRVRQQKIDALRVEQQRIEAELETVKKIAHDAEPVVVFENPDGTRVIVDLDSAIQPSSQRTYD